MRELVLIHGRSQEDKNSIALKAEWIDAWRQGLATTGLKLPIPETSIRFPYYGQTLFDMAIQLDPDYVAKIITRGTANAKERDFVIAVLQDVLEAKSISEDEVRKITDDEVLRRGVQNWPVVLAMLKALDKHLPVASTASIALLTQDVYCYLFNQLIRKEIDKGVTEAITAGTPAVVVGHSLGSVVAYKILHALKPGDGYKVPLFMTLGSPLAISTIRTEIGAAKLPACVDVWFNARDPKDVVALFPLSAPHFKLNPAIENKNNVANDTSNHHGITGYLKDPVVAKRLHDALLE